MQCEYGAFVIEGGIGAQRGSRSRMDGLTMEITGVGAGDVGHVVRKWAATKSKGLSVWNVDGKTRNPSIYQTLISLSRQCVEGKGR